MRLSAERVNHKLFGGQFGAIQITLGHAVATDIQLARDANRHRTALWVQQVKPCIAHRATNRNAALACFLDFVSRGERGRFRRAVAVEQMLRRAFFQYATDDCRIEHVATDDQVAQLAEYRHQTGGVLMEQTCGHPQHADFLFKQQCAEAFLREQHILLDDYHATAIEQRCPDVEGAGVEGRVRGKRHAILGIEFRVTVVDHQAVDGAVRDQNALWRAGRARGVHDVGRRFAGLWQLRVRGQVIEGYAVQIHSFRVFGHRGCAQCQHHLCAAVLHHEALTFGGCAEVQRHIDRRAFEDRQLADQQIKRALQQNRHAVPRLYAKTDQMMGQLIGPVIEFVVGQALRVVDCRCGLWLGVDLRFEQCMNGLVLRIAARRGVEAHQQLLALGGRQDRQAEQRGVRRLLQGIDQLLQRNIQIGANTLGTDLRHGQRGHAEAFTEIVHRQGQRVVGAFFVAQGFDPLPRRQGFA
ncbi:hypothetical protein FX983_06544 [Pseudomonas frederiksbergensis]|uniref:Uncharacterized protein n=1 Tax=Pseudomonas frederiksbergensis TaxID=104087 RepID=A0A6L5BPR0_9PSED|nr:hypothetical protein FX983_06544 [Pseudomonas frederiksbergensis]